MSHSFTQESNFWYLCGIDEPEWKLIIDGTRGRSYLVAPSISDTHRTFDGGLSAEEAQKIGAVDEVISADAFHETLRQLSRKHELVYTVGRSKHAEYYNFELNPAIGRNEQTLAQYFTKVQDCQDEIATLRSIKQPDEIHMLQKAITLTVSAFESIHSNMNSYKNEYEIEAEFAYRIRGSGASGCAYDSIVASGKNACTLHYSKNSSRLRAHQLVLMDMGATYNGYAADITRTFSKGEPSHRQREVHAAVETAHNRIISMLAPMRSVESYQTEVDEIMAQALMTIGLPHDSDAVRRYFPHAISHGLGIDVHDSLGKPKYFQENMVLTVEPGIYIPEEGIGVRIEDDILITSGGRTNLSAKLSTRL